MKLVLLKLTKIINGFVNLWKIETEKIHTKYLKYNFYIIKYNEIFL